uniref:NADH dehydrogenase subunit 4 n=1 Tax=Carychium tridentatum TaxID=145635 RepID=UPI0025A9549D|nr:NADH dehydrogenase subunit 4 [Carychium tridentatum]WIV81379.1 NADH dehydrogenase subunit 4 [Carychium tridentatum]
MFFGTMSCWFLFSWSPIVVAMSVVSMLAFCFLKLNFSVSVMNSIMMNSSISNLLVFLSVLLCFLSIISTSEEKNSLYLFMICSLGVILVLVFSSLNVFWFYIFFEASLIPTLILIVSWGYQPERLQAGSYMMLYTVTASLPLLILLFSRCYLIGTSTFLLVTQSNLILFSILSLAAYGAFLVKLPMYSFHLWLPKAHVEAPLAGSMILAGILLKLGGYGLIQMNKMFNIGGNETIGFLMVSISMWGGLLATLMCLRQVDMKALVAYSSVGHMGLVSSGILLDRSWGVTSATVTMLAHGLSSSALFCLAYYTYQKVHSRSLPYLGGFIVAFPILSMFWFFFGCVNMAAPPSLNLMGELMVVPSLWSAHLSFILIMGLMVFFSAAYNMYLYASINHGGMSTSMVSSYPMLRSEIFSLVLHIFPLLILFKASVLM